MNYDYDYDYDDDDDAGTAVAPAPKTPEQIEADRQAHEAWFSKNGEHDIDGDTYPVKDRLRAIGCRWQPFSKKWIATGDEMFATAKLIVADHQAAIRAAAPPNPPALPEFSKSPGGEGEKITVEVTVEKCWDFQTEFNRKKIVQYAAIFADAEGRKFKWVSASMPSEIVTGAKFALTGTIKGISEKDGQIVTSLIRCKIGGEKKITLRKIVLFSDGKSSADRIAVCGEDGGALMCGAAGLPSSGGDNTDHELAAALAALGIAAKMKNGDAKIEVELRVDASWLVGMVGKAKPLRDFARKNGLEVKMKWIPGEENPADKFTVTGGEITFSPGQ